jgi:hypothetical protein
VSYLDSYWFLSAASEPAQPEAVEEVAEEKPTPAHDGDN